MSYMALFYFQHLKNVVCLEQMVSFKFYTDST